MPRSVWISAATQVPILIGIGAGVLVAGRIGRGATPAGSCIEPGLLRTWSRVGAAVSVLAYLIEYFPSHLGWRLEVNHPLYALAWLGGGELLCAALPAGVAGAPSSRRSWIAGGLGAGGLKRGFQALLVRLPQQMLMGLGDTQLDA